MLGLLVRVTGGEEKLKIPALLKYPGYDCVLKKQNFPFRTLAMILSLSGCIVGSMLFTDPHPLSPDGEETPFCRKVKPSMPTSPNPEVQIVDKMRLEGIIYKMTLLSYTV